jgi:hypothetical protein
MTKLAVQKIYSFKIAIIFNKNTNFIAGDYMGYSQKNSKGVTYYLHSRDGKLFYFSKDPNNAVDLPPGFYVEETKTGMLVVKKKQ